MIDPLDAPLPDVMAPVTFLDGSLAGKTVECDNFTHHWEDRKTGEYWQRYSEAPDGVLKSYFKLRRTT